MAGFSTLYLLHYNNYYNRIVKKESSLSDYLQYLVTVSGQSIDSNNNSNVITGVNFNPNDYINTTQVVNWDGDDPDYLIVEEDSTGKLSRWFIVATNRLRSGQLQLELHRDLVVEYYDQILTAPMFIEKATLNPNDDLIFNNEDMSFNQIKTSETLLKDATKCPWICLYAARKNSEGTTTTFNISTTSTEYPVIATFDNEDDFRTFLNNPIVGNAQLSSLIFGSRYYTSYYRYYTATVSVDNSASQGLSLFFTDLNTSDATSGQFEAKELWSNSKISLIENMKTAIKPTYNLAVSNLSSYVSVDDTNYNKYKNANGAFVKVGTDKYYQLRVLSTTEGSQRVKIKNGNIWDKFKVDMQPFYADSLSNKNALNVGYLVYQTSRLVITASAAPVEVLSTNVGVERRHLIDAPYDLFCMPFSDDIYLQVGTGTPIRNAKNIAYRIANEFALSYGVGETSTIYDIQLLPYCPIKEFDISIHEGLPLLNIGNQTSLYSPIQADNRNVGYILHAQLSSFSDTISFTKDIENYKMENETDLYRLSSPNYNGLFDFSAAKNGGIHGFNVQCTYKPYNPYIKLYPTWGRLYGSNFSEDGYDARGLICGGDFSLPIVQSSWTNYQLQNKNYQLMFDRQIQNMEVNNKYQRLSEIVGAGVGVAQGAAAGGLAGSIIPGVGTAVGAVTGGIASLAGGIADVAINDKLRKEAIDYTKDQFGYQLGNIQALPQSLSKVTAYNIDNKYFPFLEFYTCSEDEKKALANKIAYNGMTVMTIGSIADYISNQWSYGDITAENYIKGKLIRSEDIDEDFHILNAIGNELNQGVYFNA